MAPIEAIARNLLRAIDGFAGVYAVGLMCMMCNKQNRRLGDCVAGTVVVHDKTIDAVTSAEARRVMKPPQLPNSRLSQHTN
jgi:uncharacterized RDD family membrane protein YckC